MAKNSETWLYHQVAKYGFVFKVVGGMMQKSGMPDVYMCYQGKQFWLELKVRGNKLSDQQRLVMKRMQRALIPCWVLRWKNEVFSVENIEREMLYESSTLEAALTWILQHFN